MQAQQLNQPVASGTCQLCGKHKCPQLWMLYLGDWCGWTCAECIQQVMDSQERRFVPAGEHTEPGE